MNGHVKSIVEEATVEVRSHGAYGEVERYSKVDIEKLVGLIVRECATLCVANGAYYQYSFTPAKAKTAETASIACANLIKKRFGIQDEQTSS
jgi:hypothetical protein